MKIRIFKAVSRFVLMLSLMGVSASCSHPSSGDNTPHPDPQDAPWPVFGRNANGYINGYDWNFKKGRAFVLRRHNNDYLVVQLWNEDIDNPCSERVGSILQARLTAPRIADHWVLSPDDPFNPNLSIFFSDLDASRSAPRDSMRADQGRIAFYSLDANTVHGYFEASFSAPKTGHTEVEGDFQIPLCPGTVNVDDPEVSLSEDQSP